MQIEWAHIATEGAVYLVPTLGVGYLGYKKILWTLSQFRLHEHGEDDPRDEERFERPLLVKGIRYPRNGH